MSNSVLQVDGVNGCATVAANSVFRFGTGSFGIAFWIKTTNIVSGKNVFGCKYSNSDGWRVVLDEMGDVIFQANNWQTFESYDVPVNDGEWHHCILTTDRENFARVYIDGVLVAEDSGFIQGMSILSANADFTIGRYMQWPAEYLSCSLDDIRIYKSALTATEVSEIYNNGIGRKYSILSTGKAASWASDCDSSSGTTLHDAVDSLNGTLSGGASFVSGGIPFAPSGVDYYIAKRDEVVVDYILDPVSKFDLNEDVSQLADGYYDYTLTPVGSNGVQGTAGEPLRLKVTSGVLSFVPSADPTGLTVVPVAAGKFKLSWLYPITTGMNLPDKFNVYWLTYEQPMNWTKDGEIAFVVGQAPVYTSVNSWTNGTLVYFKVQAQKGVEEKTNSVSVSATADTVGPTVSDPAIVIDVM